MLVILGVFLLILLGLVVIFVLEVKYPDEEEKPIIQPRRRFKEDWKPKSFR